MVDTALTIVDTCTVPEILKSATFEAWITDLGDRQAQARVNARVRRLSLGNPGDARPVRSGVSEMRIDYGPGYRVYYQQRSEVAAILCAGDKSTQDADIKRAIAIAKDWKWPPVATKPVAAATSRLRKK
jgi:putative addiction module killer protein